MKLKLDEKLGHRWRDLLVESGYDVDTVYEESLSGVDDPTVLEAAIAAGRALITLDLDFANPFRFPPGRTSGIAVLRVSERPGRHDIDLIVAELIQGLSRADLTGRLWIIEPGRIRQFEEPNAEGA